MKHLITRTLTSLALAVMGLSVAAPAQVGQTTKATIPFDFTVGKKTLPAGNYSLSQPEQGLLTVRDDRGHAIAQVLTVGIDGADLASSPKLKFAKSEGVYILTEVWDGADLGQEVLGAKKQLIFGNHRSPESRAAAEGSQP
jgi:hypothetical protein